MTTHDGEVEKSTWALQSGVWRSDGTSGDFSLENTALHNQRSSSLSDLDIASLMGNRTGVGNVASYFPPEFKYSPKTGSKLDQVPLAGAPWIPPFGSEKFGQKGLTTVKGLQQTSRSLRLHKHLERRADGQFDKAIAGLPEGDYEFFSLPLGTFANTLMALEPVRGAIFIYLELTERWEALEHANGGLLAESGIERNAWRSVVQTVGMSSRIFLPTTEGLAVIVADAPALTFSVNYSGQGYALGAPINFGDSIWMPVRTTNGLIKLVSALEDGTGSQTIAVSIGDQKVERLQAPTADKRLAIWPCDGGQLVLRQQANGEMEGTFIAWPQGLVPQFTFGCPALTRDGSLWQLCFSDKRQFVYTRLGTVTAESHIATGPRLSTGAFNYRLASRSRSDPWIEPEHGDDATVDDLIIPLLESPGLEMTLGAKLQSNDAIANIMQSKAKVRVVMVIDEPNSEIEFAIISISEPWRIRFFIHSGTLWAYHSNLSKIQGWRLEA